jgi:hypothetical protein
MRTYDATAIRQSDSCTGPGATSPRLIRSDEACRTLADENNRQFVARAKGVRTGGSGP